MSVRQFQSKKCSGPRRAGSRSDHTDYDSATSESRITKRKHKQSENEYVRMADFKDFRKEILSYLENIKKSNDEFIHIIKSEINEIKTQVSTVIKTIDILSEKQLLLKNDLADLSKSLDFHTKSFDDLKIKTNAISKEITQIKKLEQEVETYKCRLLNVEREFNIQQQRDRLYNIEISAISALC
ncbi:unnamed protein product [Euphydryas editha]|uniref:Uncharacterized protein n=1 Tax=Euphydryas editha TaxID=104508 RepID=A0AAU9U952_EUPED|nr:unnamed protein product [Euphydryas editha]